MGVGGWGLPTLVNPDFLFQTPNRTTLLPIFRNPTYPRISQDFLFGSRAKVWPVSISIPRGGRRQAAKFLAVKKSWWWWWWWWLFAPSSSTKWSIQTSFSWNQIRIYMSTVNGFFRANHSTFISNTHFLHCSIYRNNCKYFFGWEVPGGPGTFDSCRGFLSLREEILVSSCVFTFWRKTIFDDILYCLVILVYLWHFSCYLAEEKTMFSTAVSNLISINDTCSVDPPLTGCPKSQPKVS